MFLKVCLVAVIGSLSVVNAQTPFCSGGLCFIRPDSYPTSVWSDAQQSCKDNNATLPIVDNPNHQNAFADALKHFNFSDTDLWLGAKASDNGADHFSWLDGSQYKGTDVQERGDYYKSYAVVAKRTADVLAYATPPNNTFSYICQCNASTPADACTNETGRTAFFMDNRCYMKYDEKLDWFSARNKCLANFGDLASFSSLSLLDGIVGNVGSWVGLRSSQWKWQNALTGSSWDVTYTSWAIGQPNDAVANCLSVDSGAFPNWKDFDCLSSYSYICQVSDTSVSPTTSSSTTSSSSSSAFSMTSTTSTGSVSMGTPESTTTTTSASTRSSQSTSEGVRTSENSTKSSISESVMNLGLPIGLGVGLGVPFIILIVVIIVIVAIYISRKRRQNGALSETTTKKFVKNARQKDTENGTLEMKDKTKKKKGPDDPSSHYATVRETNPGALIVTPSTNQDINYADLRFQTNDSS